MASSRSPPDVAQACPAATVQAVPAVAERTLLVRMSRLGTRGGRVLQSLLFSSHNTWARRYNAGECPAAASWVLAFLVAVVLRGYWGE